MLKWLRILLNTDGKSLLLCAKAREADASAQLKSAQTKELIVKTQIAADAAAVSKARVKSIEGAMQEQVGIIRQMEKDKKQLADQLAEASNKIEALYAFQNNLVKEIAALKSRQHAG